MKYVLFILIMILISGCASKYKEPTIGEYATITIPHNKTKYNFGFSGESYLISILNETSCVDSWQIIEEKNKDKEFETIKIPVGKNIAINSFLYSGNSNCRLVGTFKSEIGKNYALSSKIIGDTCYMYVSEKNNNQEIFIKINILKIENSMTGKMCFK
ncbi:hypothetical protein [Aliarcobacter butzleri]|uniref:Lipoprotein n=1 Tax=Aliarcobacter butzleri L351 TaxID=1447259 RepID=A0A837J576_9BACT|nr:hypothetical protein [Aliarcobacter butzleri]KLE00570.1 hypothetical protein AF76_07585 [Aliarcobacter butzleri L351]KLE13455.1 hypothetical protein AF75_03480 [Aliarcobacter butzleri L350]MCG3680080.1 hypothetical protein [Aliarcobacter butzleri]MDN5058420.1 hypothetical protein [Aliarcobacter butzleri]MDN5108944.1 hypothetical protein [Aliarcobacter butzleri]